MLDGMRPRRQLGEEENGNEKEMAQTDSRAAV
jgi:hypothetical protein